MTGKILVVMRRKFIPMRLKFTLDMSQRGKIEIWSGACEGNGEVNSACKTFQSHAVLYGICEFFF